MNIFAVSDDPVVCARVLDDRRLIKMTLETAQILSTAAKSVLPQDLSHLLYKPTHARHPVTLWAGRTQSNLFWTASLLEALGREYTRRFHRHHASAVRLAPVVEYIRSQAPRSTTTPFANCSGVPGLPIFDAYRQCLTIKWQADTSKGRAPKWTNVTLP